MGSAATALRTHSRQPVLSQFGGHPSVEQLSDAFRHVPVPVCAGVEMVVRVEIVSIGVHILVGHVKEPDAMLFADLTAGLRLFVGHVRDYVTQ